ncbi:MAG: hypothetical protein GY937_18080 [bacterium]|nr:hypothetical protein [bacterium]
MAARRRKHAKQTRARPPKTIPGAADREDPADYSTVAPAEPDRVADAEPSSPIHGRLYYGDNLDVLRRHVKDESVDLVYLDPPFQSGKDYNILFDDKRGRKSTAQIKAFEDTWCWDRAAEIAFHESVEIGGQLAGTLVALRKILGESDMMAYLVPCIDQRRKCCHAKHCVPRSQSVLAVSRADSWGPYVEEAVSD